MSKANIFSLINDKLIEDYSMNDEKFNIFIASGFLNNQKYDEAIQQIQLGINSSNRPYVSYLFLIAIAIETSDLENLDTYINNLNKDKLPKDIMSTLELILSNIPIEQTDDIKSNSKFEILVNNLCSSDKNFVGWISFRDNVIETSISIPMNFFDLISSIQSEIISEENKVSQIIGNVKRVVYEFESKKLFFVNINEKSLFFLGNENFAINYILLKLNEG